MLKILDKIVFLVSLSAIAGLLGAYTSSYINPNTFVWASLLGLAYPYLLITSILPAFLLELSAGKNELGHARRPFAGNSLRL